MPGESYEGDGDLEAVELRQIEEDDNPDESYWSAGELSGEETSRPFIDNGRESFLDGIVSTFIDREDTEVYSDAEPPELPPPETWNLRSHGSG